MLGVLGAGNFGKVLLVRKMGGADNGHLYAMKQLLKADIINDNKIMEYAITERQVLEAVRHAPFLVGLQYAFQTDDKLHLILDYVSGGDLFTYFDQHKIFAEEEVRFYIGEIVLALEQLHKIGIIYRDLKPENILIDSEGHIILTDFGLCKMFLPHETPRAYSYCGTVEYMSPEVIRGSPSGHGMAVDWWSTGVLTCELLAGDNPFSVDGKRKYHERFRRRILTAKPRIPDLVSSEASDFILKLLVKDPQKRLGGGEDDAEELKSHPFFKELDWSALGQKRISAPYIPSLANETDVTNISEEIPAPSNSCGTAPPSSGDTFRGYSFVRPSILFSENVISGQPTGDRFLSSENISSCKFRESRFFENYELDLKEGILGDGSFSVCRKCTNRQTGKEFAVKTVNREIDCTQEIKLLQTCQGHPNIVDLHEVYYDEAHTYIVLELLRGGELLDRIRKKGRFTESEARRIMRKLISALNYMHSCGVVHRDLKPENVLFTDDSEEADIKIVDFGFAGLKQEKQPMHALCFTLQYAAPEVLKEAFSNGTDGYDENCDLWSLGVILYTMLSGCAPFHIQSDDDGAAVLARIKGGEFRFNIDAMNDISSEAKYMTKGLLTVDPKDRLKMSDLRNSEWVQECSAKLQPSTLHVALDILAHTSETGVKQTFSALHHAPQEGFRVQVVVNAELPQRTWTEKQSTDTCSHSTSSTQSASSSSGTPLAQVDESHNGGLISFTSEGRLIQSRKRKINDAASVVFVNSEDYNVDMNNNDSNVKRKKCEVYCPV